MYLTAINNSRPKEKINILYFLKINSVQCYNIYAYPIQGVEKNILFKLAEICLIYYIKKLFRKS